MSLLTQGDSNNISPTHTDGKTQKYKGFEVEDHWGDLAANHQAIRADGP